MRIFKFSRVCDVLWVFCNEQPILVVTLGVAWPNSRLVVGFSQVFKGLRRMFVYFVLVAKLPSNILIFYSFTVFSRTRLGFICACFGASTGTELFSWKCQASTCHKTKMTNIISYELPEYKIISPVCAYPQACLRNQHNALTWGMIKTSTEYHWRKLGDGKSLGSNVSRLYLWSV